MVDPNESIIYEGKDLELFKNVEHWKKYFSKMLVKYIQGNVLEVGAGMGTNTQYMAKNIELVKSWNFIEPDENLAGQIEHNTRNLNFKEKRIINGTIASIKNDKFDTIIYIDVLEHVLDSKGEIEIVKQHMNPGGTLLILVPAYNFLYNNFDKRVGHFRRYNKKLLLNEINNNFLTKELFYIDSVGFFASLANKLFLKEELPSINQIKFWDRYMVTSSRLIDRIVFRTFGKSLIGIFKNE